MKNKLLVLACVVAVFFVACSGTKTVGTPEATAPEAATTSPSTADGEVAQGMSAFEPVKPGLLADACYIDGRPVVYSAQWENRYNGGTAYLRSDGCVVATDIGGALEKLVVVACLDVPCDSAETTAESSIEPAPGPSSLEPVQPQLFNDVCTVDGAPLIISVDWATQWSGVSSYIRRDGALVSVRVSGDNVYYTVVDETDIICKE